MLQDRHIQTQPWAQNNVQCLEMQYWSGKVWLYGFRTGTVLHQAKLASPTAWTWPDRGAGSCLLVPTGHALHNQPVSKGLESPSQLMVSQVGTQGGTRYYISTFLGRHYGFTFSCGLAFSLGKQGECGMSQHTDSISCWFVNIYGELGWEGLNKHKAFSQLN